MNVKQLGMRTIRAMRASIIKNENKVFAQLQEGGSWFAVLEIKIVGGIIWVRIEGMGSWMVHAIKMSNDLPEPGAGSGEIAQPAIYHPSPISKSPGA